MALAGGNSMERLGWRGLDASFSENFEDSILLVGWFKLRPNDLYFCP